jgi:hypothetical protein
METLRSVEISGSRPTITNSVVPMPNAPIAKASKARFTGIS